MMHHPHISSLYELYQSETQPFRKVHRMIDLFESIIKSHTVVILGEYVTRNKLSDAAKGMLAQGLRTPTLGTWQLFSRVLFEELQSDGHTWAFPDFPVEFEALDKALQSDKTNVIAFRNGYAHGATPDDIQCEADIARFAPFLEKLLQSRWLQSTQVIVRDGRVWMDGATAQVSVHPVLIHKEEGAVAPFAFFNDLKNDKVGLLNYPLSKHYREKELFQEFHEHLPLHEWKKSGNNEFIQRIEELTETFKGRTQERERLLQFVRSQNKGYFSIQGNPGIGKSALIAQFFKDLRSQKDLGEVFVVEYFIRRGTAQAKPEYVFDYLIRRTDELFAQGKEIRAEGKSIWDLQQQLFNKWRSWAEHSRGKKLLFMIDGLDEGTDDNVVSYLPRENFDGVIIVYGSRPGGHKSIDDLWSQLPLEHHTKLELSGLGREDIRALIYEVANKYELERDSAWIDAVQQRSQGNPLYLKLLCDAIEHGTIALNDIKALPDKIDEYYKAILDRYANDPVDGDELLAGLFTFAAARDFLSMAHLGLMNQLGDATVQRIGSTLKEVLYENPLTETVLDYQLFHESFREYLIREKSKQVTDAAERIIDFCATWKDLEGNWEQRYALEHYAAHASASKKESRAMELLDLLHNRDYAATQKKILKQFNATRDLYRLILLKASALKREEDALEAALQLIDLNYEETNDAPQVVAMVAAGDIEMALKRIESFGGPDKEGLQRKFILYMLCLMELTLLDSKDKPFRRDGIKAILHHLDENLPVDHSILKWNDFFPSYLVFLMACEWAVMGLEYMVIYKRTDSWHAYWIEEMGPYSDNQLEVLKECAHELGDESVISSVLVIPSSELAKQETFEKAVHESPDTHEKALEYARSIIDWAEKSRILSGISTELAKQGKMNEAEAVIREAIDCARSIRIDRIKCYSLAQITIELAKYGTLDKIESILNEVIGCDPFNYSVHNMPTRNFNSRLFGSISNELVKRGKFVDAISIIGKTLNLHHGIDEKKKSQLISQISSELAKQWKNEDALKCFYKITVTKYKEDALKNISFELIKQGMFEEAIKAINTGLPKIRIKYLKIPALLKIYIELFKLRKYEESQLVILEALNNAHNFSSWYLLFENSIKLANKAIFDKAIEFALEIDDDFGKTRAKAAIATELAKQGKFRKALEYARSIIDWAEKSRTLSSISTELTKQGKMDEAEAVIQEAFNCSREINDDSKYRTLINLSTELAVQGKFPKALEYAREIIYKYYKSQALINIYTELVKLGIFEEAEVIIQEALECAVSMNDGEYKIRTLGKISTELAKQGKWSTSEQTAYEITHIATRQECWRGMAKALIEQNGWNFALQKVEELKSDEAREFYLKGWTSNLSVTDVNNDCLHQALPILAGDTQSLEQLLQNYALHEVFLGSLAVDQISRLNFSLNIQWALDLKSSFTSSEKDLRLSTNLDTWLHEIEDEDDHDQIELWAKQVAKGKITEEQFSQNVRGMG